MTSRSHRPIRVASSAVPAFAGALVASAYLVGAVVFSWASQSGGASADAAVLAEQIAAPRSGLPADSTVGAGPVLAEALSEPLDVGTSRVVPVETGGLPARPLTVTGPRIAIVIDDVGLDVAAARRTLALDADVTVAILPYAEAAPQIAGEAAAAGHDVLLHMPMEPLGLADPGPNALRAGLGDGDLQARIRWAMARVPGAIGLNNHMGSRFTQDPRALRVALSAVAADNPLFLDSLTTGESRGAAVASGLGLRALERDIFLDHVIDREAIAARLAEAEDLARTRGHAVVIGHPHDATLDVLEAWIAGARERGIELVGVADLEAGLEPGAMAGLDAPGPARN